MKKLVNVLILLGALSFLAAIFQKISYCICPFTIIPTSFIKFSVVSLLLAIAISTRKA